MRNMILIRNKDDEEAFLEELMEEMGVTKEEFFGNTDFTNPPFKPGDKVWIDSMPGNIPNDMVQKIREQQTVESVTPLSSSDEPLWWVNLVDIPYIFTPKDVRLYDQQDG